MLLYHYCYLFVILLCAGFGLALVSDDSLSSPFHAVDLIQGNFQNHAKAFLSAIDTTLSILKAENWVPEFAKFRALQTQHRIESDTAYPLGFLFLSHFLGIQEHEVETLPSSAIVSASSRSNIPASFSISSSPPSSPRRSPFAVEALAPSTNSFLAWSGSPYQAQSPSRAGTSTSVVITLNLTDASRCSPSCDVFVALSNDSARVNVDYSLSATQAAKLASVVRMSAAQPSVSFNVSLLYNAASTGRVYFDAKVLNVTDGSGGVWTQQLPVARVYVDKASVCVRGTLVNAVRFSFTCDGQSVTEAVYQRRTLSDRSQYRATDPVLSGTAVTCGQVLSAFNSSSDSSSAASRVQAACSGPAWLNPLAALSSYNKTQICSLAQACLQRRVCATVEDWRTGCVCPFDYQGDDCSQPVPMGCTITQTLPPSDCSIGVSAGHNPERAGRPSCFSVPSSTAIVNFAFSMKCSFTQTMQEGFSDRARFAGYEWDRQSINFTYFVRDVSQNFALSSVPGNNTVFRLKFFDFNRLGDSKFSFSSALSQSGMFLGQEPFRFSVDMRQMSVDRFASGGRRYFEVGVRQAAGDLGGLSRAPTVRQFIHVPDWNPPGSESRFGVRLSGGVIALIVCIVVLVSGLGAYRIYMLCKSNRELQDAHLRQMQQNQHAAARVPAALQPNEEAGVSGGARSSQDLLSTSIPDRNGSSSQLISPAPLQRQSSTPYSIQSGKGYRLLSSSATPASQIFLHEPLSSLSPAAASFPERASPVQGTAYMLLPSTPAQLPNAVPSPATVAPAAPAAHADVEMISRSSSSSSSESRSAALPLGLNAANYLQFLSRQANNS